MALPAVESRTLRLGLGCAAAALAAAAILQTPLAAVDGEILRAHYALRGEEQADSSIVLVYLDNDAVATLGWPVRRNFHALMVKALTDLQVRAVGIDVQFQDPATEYPEYDALLAAMVQASGRVVLPCYFREVRRGPPPESVPGARPFAFPEGSGVRLPMEQLRKGAAGLGHGNVTETNGIPVFVISGDSLVPSFAAEILRVGTEGNLTGSGTSIAVRGRGGHEFPLTVDDAGTAMLRYPGSLRSFRSHPFLEVLRSYDEARADRPGTVPVVSFKGKIVLVGVIAEGRSAFFPTPVDPRFPGLALHATFLDNALRSGFLRQAPAGVTYGVALLAALAGAALILLPRRKVARLLVPAAALLLLAGAHVLFRNNGIVLPVVGPLAALLLSSLGALLVRQREAEERVVTLLGDRERIARELRDREERLAALERELVRASAARESDRVSALMEEIRTYKEEIRSLASKADDMEEAGDAGGDTGREFEGIIHAAGGPMTAVTAFVGKIADSPAPVLITGESGTGKELIARALHRLSARRDRAFVAVNCGALAENLLESELFGHERGAFTGAVKDKQGRFELADGGTIFLDEIGEVSEAFQLRLLRVLQEGEFERVGGTRTLRTDVRVVAATNRNLDEQVRIGRFREDLFYRLNVLTVSLPPLRERREDIPLLVRHFLRSGGGEMTVSRNVMEALTHHPWRGNVRELESAVTRAKLLARADGRTMVAMKDLGGELAASGRRAMALEDQVLDTVREKGFSRSSVSETAEELGGMNRGTAAEYLRGQCLRLFVEQGFDLERAVTAVSVSADPEVNARVRKRLIEYLENIAAGTDPGRPWDEGAPALRAKMKNLPQRYHGYLTEAARAFHAGTWKLPQ
jgi:transcriptional regulator with GAF, ATPase, and Fis domain/CHASE2 domain-containing sensor protein